MKGCVLLGLWLVAVCGSVSSQVVKDGLTPEKQVDLIVGQASLFPDQLYQTINWKEFSKWEAVHREIDPNNVDYNLLNAAVFYFTNEYRRNRGIHTLKFSLELRDAAVFHSMQMVSLQFYDHINTRNRKFRTSVQRVEYFGYKGNYVAENIAYEFLYDYEDGKSYWYTDLGNGNLQYHYGNSRNVEKIMEQRTYWSFAKALVDSWIASKSHRHNLQSKSLRYLGCGVLIDPHTIGSKEIPKAVGTQNFGG